MARNFEDDFAQIGAVGAAGPGEEERKIEESYAKKTNKTQNNRL